MRFHHLNCGTMCPHLVGADLACHVVLIELPGPAGGLALVDTGLGTADVADRGRALPGFFRLAARPRLDPSETALARVRALGFDPADVRHILLTHLDLDHAGGLPDFPWATAHVHARELDAARRCATRNERARYLTRHIAGHSRWQTYDGDGEGERWMGLEALHPLVGLSGGAGDDLALLPLHGHTRGHTAIAMHRPDGTWMLHAGDGYFDHREVHPGGGRPPRALRMFQRLVDRDTRTRRANQERLASLAAQRSDVHVFCAHDASELAALAGSAQPVSGLAQAADSY